MDDGYCKLVGTLSGDPARPKFTNFSYMLMFWGLTILPAGMTLDFCTSDFPLTPPDNGLPAPAVFFFSSKCL